MKRMLTSSLAALAVLSLASLAGAQSDCSKIVPASLWGPNDQTGATNRITPGGDQGRGRRDQGAARSSR